MMTQMINTDSRVLQHKRKRAIRHKLTPIEQLMRRWPTRAALARDLVVSYWTVAAWAYRNSIPPQWHDLVLRSAARHGVRISPEMLDRAQTRTYGNRRDKGMTDERDNRHQR